jgi:hypothetical protein
MTNKDLISQYVNLGEAIPEYQYNKLNNNDKKTYQRKRNIIVNTFNIFTQIYPYEYKFFDSKFFDALIEKNIINIGSNFYKNFKNFPEDVKSKYVAIMIDNNKSISSEYIFKYLSDNDKIKYLNWSANQGLNRMGSSEHYSECSEELKVIFLKKLIELNGIETFLKEAQWKVSNYNEYSWEDVLNLIKKYNLDK